MGEFREGDAGGDAKGDEVVGAGYGSRMGAA